ncbi:uncharacterized protein LOC141883685 isoform X2 [Acropora palmata]
MFASWTLMVSLMGTTCLIVLPLTSSRRSRFQHFLLKLVTVHFEPEILRGIVSKAKVYANVFSFVVIFAIGAEIISDIFLDISIGTYEPWKSLRILRIIIQFLRSYGIAVWFTFPFFCTTCNLLEALFDDFNKRVSSLPLNSKVSVKALREQHRHLSQVVQIADNMISPLLFEAVGFFIPVICFTFYQITHADLSKQKITAIGNIGVNSFWLLSSSGILLMVMTFGSRLNEKIHAIQKIVQTLHVAPEDEGKLLLFVIDLQDEPRGVTVGGFAVITKSLSLTIYGLIVSYFTVMLSLPD